MSTYRQKCIRSGGLVGRIRLESHNALLHAHLKSVLDRHQHHQPQRSEEFDHTYLYLMEHHRKRQLIRRQEASQGLFRFIKTTLTSFGCLYPYEPGVFVP